MELSSKDAQLNIDKVNGENFSSKAQINVNFRAGETEKRETWQNII